MTSQFQQPIPRHPDVSQSKLPSGTDKKSAVQLIAIGDGAVGGAAAVLLHLLGRRLARKGQVASSLAASAGRGVA